MDKYNFAFYSGFYLLPTLDKHTIKHHSISETIYM